MRLLIVLVAAATLAALLLVVADRTVVSSSPHRASQTPDAAAPATSAVEPERGDVPTVRTANELVLHVVGAQDQPLPEATGSWHGDSRAATFRAKPAVEADEAGKMRLGSAPSGNRLLVRAPGHVPALVEVIGAGAQTVRLQAAASLTVVVVRADNDPVPEAVVTLSIDGTTEFLMGPALPAPGIGDPVADRPLWVTKTNGVGQANFDELPPGTFFLNVIASPLAPSEGHAANGRLQLDSGPAVVNVVMEELHGVAFAVPSPSPVKSLRWSAPILSLDRSPGVLSRIGGAKATLERRFEQALVYAHRPLHDEQVTVGCHVVLEDGTAWFGEWPLMPISEVNAVVHLERDPRLRRDVTVRLVDVAGTELRDVEFAFVPAEATGPGAKGVVQAATGTPSSLAHGVYTLVPGSPTKAIFLAMQAARVAVDAASDPEHWIRVDSRLVDVRVRIVYPTDEVLAPVEIYVDGEPGEDNIAIVNWRPSRGPIRRIMAMSKVNVFVQSVAYEDVRFVDLPIPESGVLDLQIELRQKPVQPR